MVVWTPIVEMQTERGSGLGDIVVIELSEFTFEIEFSLWSTLKKENVRGEMKEKMRIALRYHTHSNLVQIYMLNAQVSMKS